MPRPQPCTVQPMDTRTAPTPQQIAAHLRAANAIAAEAQRQARRQLEARVAERTQALAEANAALQVQMAERQRLEHELIRLSEHEQQRFGRELHDGLGQHLTAAAIQALHGLAGEANKDPFKLAEFSASAALLGLKPVAADMSGIDEAAIKAAITARLEALNGKNWAEADRIRDELASQGIALKDSKDSETGARVTTWEMKR